MSKGNNERKLIFEKYRSNLNLLIDSNLLLGRKDFYVCPICLKPHSDLDLEDPLTLEDAPPKSLGGKANTLTCKSCNNTCGYKIDFHLTERLREIDSAKFIPDTETNVKVKIKDEVFQGKLKVESDGTLRMYHSNKNNHPLKLEGTIKDLKSGMVVNLEFLKSRVIPENLEYALLKTGYLLAFEKFGYSLIFYDCFNIVRKQLQDPKNRIYPNGFWISPPFDKNMNGVYFVCDEGLECLLVLFNLDTGNSVRMFGVFLPLPINDLNSVISSLNLKFEAENKVELSLYPLEQSEANYIDDIPNLKAMYDWIKTRAKY